MACRSTASVSFWPYASTRRLASAKASSPSAASSSRTAAMAASSACGQCQEEQRGEGGGCKYSLSLDQTKGI
jgi:hypothetical protein